MVRPRESISLSLEEVAVCTGHKVLMEVDANILPIVGDQQGILDLPNFAIILDNCIKLNIIKSFKKLRGPTLKKGGGGLALLQALVIQNKSLGGPTTLNIMTFSIVTISIRSFYVTLSISDTLHK